MMTQEQFERWQQFSRGMARRGFKRMTDARRQKLLDAVNLWFDSIGNEWQHMTSWDDSEVIGQDRYGHSICATLAGDWVDELFDQHYHEDKRGELRGRFMGEIRCCIRAGMDVAAEPSAGVVGFDVDDVKRIFGGVIPTWFAAEYPGIETAEPTNGVWL